MAKRTRIILGESLANEVEDLKSKGVGRSLVVKMLEAKMRAGFERMVGAAVDLVKSRPTEEKPPEVPLQLDPVQTNDLKAAAEEAGIPMRELGAAVAEIAADEWGGKVGRMVVDHLQLSPPGGGNGPAKG